MAVSGGERLLMLQLAVPSSTVLVIATALAVNQIRTSTGGVAKEPGSVARVLHGICVEEGIG